jgi:uncharacterized membrane protein YkoI
MPECEAGRRDFARHHVGRLLMYKLLVWSSAVVFVALLAVAPAVRADDEKIDVDKLPKEVVKAVKDRFPGAELKSAEKETEDGKTIYDVAIKHKDINYEVAVTPKGEITGFEKEIAAKDMPKEVAKAIETKYPKATVKMVEEVYKVKGKTEKLEYYEIAIVTSENKKVGLDVAADGKILKSTEEKKKD